ncbi:MAG: DNA-binding protein [Eubacterium sp.]|nr:DNA-binding protein [Eubacterium sp.]
MDERVRQSLLFDFYGELLNEHQRDVFSASVFDDMSYSELADEFGCSRQAAFDLIRRINQKLEGYEKRLGLVKRFSEARNKNKEVAELIASAKEYINKSDINSKDKKAISDYIGKIAELSDEVFDDF